MHFLFLPFFLFSFLIVLWPVAEAWADGITFEEDRNINPPPPRNLRAVSGHDGVRLHWDPPEPVSSQTAYNKKIAYYNVYRGKVGSEFRRRASLRNESFTDKGVASGGAGYIYTVTAVHVGGNESALSGEARVEPEDTLEKGSPMDN